MPRIHLLPEIVASQVAAGEVVERPASVVKELVENSLDAGATKIEVAIRRGGISYLRVVDDGHGMDRDDALLCLERHATSKIRSGDDLASIHTLGFRGEALPSIASVSRFRLATREHQALAGTEIIVNGGAIETVRDGGDAPGTQIEVRSLFFNLPARRKFLRTENTEAHHIEHQLHLQAIGHPGTGFTFVQDERLVYQLPPTRSLLERIRNLCGQGLAGELLEVRPFEREGLRISGFLGRAGLSRSSRQQQLIFLNGRAVENSTLNFALREGYHTALMKGQHPVTFLFLEMDPAAVDVNVHPAKREVRFRDGAFVRDALCEAVRRTLESDRKDWTSAFRTESTHGSVPREEGANGGVFSAGPSGGIFPTAPMGEPAQSGTAASDPALPLGPSAEVASHAAVPAENHMPAPDAQMTAGVSPTAPPTEYQAGSFTPPLIPEREQHALRHDWSPMFAAPRDESAAAAPTAKPGGSSDFKILGVLGKLYVLMENSTGLVLVDQHAAHERILFEEMRARMEAQGVPTQRLLLPLTMQVTPKDADWIMRHLELLHRAGLALEPFGPGAFKIDALPTFLRPTDPTQLLHDVIDDLRETSAQTSRLRLGEEMIAKTVCRHAVKANDVLREPELVRLIQDLLACDLPYCCPHGRPTMIQISYGELEKKFGRKV